METGVVTHVQRDKKYGFAQNHRDDEEVFFHLSQGRTFRSERSSPQFDNDPLVLLPKKGDVLIYDTVETVKGRRTVLWGLYADFRGIFSAMNSAADMVRNYPFIPDVLIKAKRLLVDGPMAVRTSPLSADLLDQVGLDDVTEGRPEYYYAIVKQPRLRVHELTSRIVFPFQGAQQTRPARTISEQLSELSISPSGEDVMLVRVAVNERLHWIPSGTGPQLPAQEIVVYTNS